MAKRTSILVFFILIFALIFSLVGYSKTKTTLKVLNAGSLLVPFGEMEKSFEEINPDVDVLIEGHGSIQVIRHVTEVAEMAGEPIADIVAVADYSLISKMMYNTLIPGTQKKYADWCIKFATNSLGLAYTSQSKYADEINVDNWYQILSRPEVKIGISDPRFDACGYRALISMKLAEFLYQQDDILQDIIGKFSYPIRVEENNGKYTILIPEILEPERLAIRDSSIKLLFALESGSIDYAFKYKSVAEQHQMKFLEFP
ncbi:MAG: tungstate ABC transporter substrate-binding protein WtpA, partial [Atribacterota bacterium]|nr:tungstate ABC transporter substrate-binding protein WtpA [Atribacterota bacterium]